VIFAAHGLQPGEKDGQLRRKAAEDCRIPGRCREGERPLAIFGVFLEKKQVFFGRKTHKYNELRILFNLKPGLSLASPSPIFCLALPRASNN
jgi:hypothetical protein